MTEKQKETLKIFEKIIPRCTERQREKILDWGEAIAYMLDHQEQKTKETA